MSNLYSTKARTLLNIFSGAASVGHPEQFIIPIKSRGSSFGYLSKNPRRFLISPKHTTAAQLVSCVQLEQVRIPIRAIFYLLSNKFDAVSAAPQRAAQGRQTVRATNSELPPDFMWGTDVEKPLRCLPSLAANCCAISIEIRHTQDVPLAVE